jgi:transcriptional regulator with XRE-family HTH domain
MVRKPVKRENLSTFCQRLWRLMEMKFPNERGQRRKFANLCDFSESELAQLLNDKRVPSLGRFKMICEKTGASPCWLLFGKEEPKWDITS